MEPKAMTVVGEERDQQGDKFQKRRVKYWNRSFPNACGAIGTLFLVMFGVWFWFLLQDINLQTATVGDPETSAKDPQGSHSCVFQLLVKDVANLMEWWNQVDSWEDTPQDDDVTEKERGQGVRIRVFNKLFSERGKGLWQHVIDLNSIAAWTSSTRTRSSNAALHCGSKRSLLTGRF